MRRPLGWRPAIFKARMKKLGISHAEVTDGDVQQVKDARWNDGEEGWDGSH